MDLFISRLKGLIEEKDITQKELAKAIDVTDVTISRYLNGDRSPRIDIVNRLAKYFNVSTDYLLNEEVETIAAHKDGEEFTEDELQDIEEFKAFVRSKRNK
nr:helix-turn-helix transcriptional regulator [Tissierella sp.]